MSIIYITFEHAHIEKVIFKCSAKLLGARGRRRRTHHIHWGQHPPDRADRCCHSASSRIAPTTNTSWNIPTAAGHHPAFDSDALQLQWRKCCPLRICFHTKDYETTSQHSQADQPLRTRGQLRLSASGARRGNANTQTARVIKITCEWLSSQLLNMLSFQHHQDARSPRLGVRRHSHFGQ